MAKRKATKTRYRTRTLRSYAKSIRSKSSGLVSGLVSGAGGQLVNKFLPLGQWSQPVADLATGHFMKNDTLTTIGGRSVGAMLVSGGLGAAGGQSNSSGNYAPLR